MTVERLERVMWRARKKAKDNILKNKDLKRAIMRECGTDPRTYKTNRAALFELKWISSYGPAAVRITDNDITGDEA